jgi:hypothetical protein
VEQSNHHLARRAKRPLRPIAAHQETRSPAAKLRQGIPASRIPERRKSMAKDQDKGVKNDKKKPAKNLKEKRAAKKEKAASHTDR